jgi:hypothetical protein
VQEYERAVIFRLGRLLSGGAKGPGKLILILLPVELYWFFSSLFVNASVAREGNVCNNPNV